MDYNSSKWLSTSGTATTTTLKPTENITSVRKSETYGTLIPHSKALQKPLIVDHIFITQSFYHFSTKVKLYSVTPTLLVFINLVYSLDFIYYNYSILCRTTDSLRSRR